MTLADATLTINFGDNTALDITAASQWGGTWEERIDGVGMASFTVQDRDPASTIVFGLGKDLETTDFGKPFLSVGRRDILRMTIPGLNLFWGEVTQSVLALPVGFPWRRWALSATDFNADLDLRLVGVPDGLTWETIDGGQTHTAIDPNAVGLASDGATITALFDHYVVHPRNIMTEAFDATTFVHDWIPSTSLIDPITGQSRLLWTNNTMRGAIDELRGLAGFPVFLWIDPDGAVHYEAFADWDTAYAGGGLSMLMPYVPFARFAPAAITDVTADLNGSTVIGGRNLSFTLDGTYMPQQPYVTGVTDFIHNADGTTTFQGTGWPVRPTGHRTALLGSRQVLVDAQAVSEAQRMAVTNSIMGYGKRARLRGTVTVGRQDEPVDGWRVGQLLPITDARLPPALNGLAYPIQRVQGTQVPGQQWREYVLEFGDFPIARFSQKYRTTPPKLASPRLPAKQLLIEWPTHHLRPSTSYTLVGQMVDRSKKPVRHAGIKVTWTMTVLDASGASVGGGSIAAVTAATDANGRNAAVLTTGSATGVHYHAKCVVAQQL
jgi:hypothetical protein